VSIKYHSFNSQNQPVDDTLAGNYTAAAPTSGDSELSTLSSNWVENRVVTAKILQDEADYLSKVDGEARYAIEYTSSVPTTIKDKIYVINGDAFLGDSTNATLTQLSKVVTVNGQSPDVNGNVSIDVGVESVNGQSPVNGDATVSASDIPTSVSGETVQDVIDGRVKTVNSVSPDVNGNVSIDVGVKTVNSNSPDANGNLNIDVGVKTVNGNTPDANGNVDTIGNVHASLSGNVLTLTF
jgi:phage tail tube protein FII